MSERAKERGRETWVRWWCLLTLFTQLQLNKVEKKKIDFVGQMFVNRNSGESTSSLSLYITAFIFIFTFFIFISLGGAKVSCRRRQNWPFIFSMFCFRMFSNGKWNWNWNILIDSQFRESFKQNQSDWLCPFLTLKQKVKVNFKMICAGSKFSHPALLLSLCYDHVLIYRVIFFSITF